MRQTKFRGKRIDTGEWVYGDYFRTPLTDENSGIDPEYGLFFLTGLGRSCIRRDDGTVCVIDPETKGEWTGLRDKKGKEIYEGDIVRCIEPDYDIDGEIYKVSWQGEHYPAFDIYDFEGQSNGLSHYNAAGSIEILGTIHDPNHEDLLK